MTEYFAVGPEVAGGWGRRAENKNFDVSKWSSNSVARSTN